jgi:hypothetical protein
VRDTLTAPTTTITGTVGQPLNPVTGIGGTYNGPATITTPGCTSTDAITGTISNGTFTPAANQTIPACTTTGPGTQTTLTPIGTGVPAPVQIPSNYSPAPGSLGQPTATTASPISGVIGNPFPQINLTGGNLPNGTPASFVPAGCTTAINGTIQNGNFVPATGSTIPQCATTGPQTGVLSSPNVPNVNVPTNFSPAATPSLGTPGAITGPVGSPMPTITLTGGNVPAGTPATFTPAGCTTGISGTITNGTWTPATGSTIPQCATTGPQTGTLTSPNYPPASVPTTFTVAQPSGPVRGGRLYFIGMDNAPVQYDNVLRYNTAYPRTQKFKDGQVTFKIDELKDAAGNPLTSGSCKFEMVRHPRAYTPANILRTYTASISNGSSQVVHPVSDQTVNYAFVIATCTSGQTTVYDSSLLVLYVGG